MIDGILSLLNNNLLNFIFSKNHCQKKFYKICIYNNTFLLMLHLPHICYNSNIQLKSVKQKAVQLDFLFKWIVQPLNKWLMVRLKNVLNINLLNFIFSRKLNLLKFIRENYYNICVFYNTILVMLLSPYVSYNSILYCQSLEIKSVQLNCVFKWIIQPLLNTYIQYTLNETKRNMFS